MDIESETKDSNRYLNGMVIRFPTLFLFRIIHNILVNQLLPNAFKKTYAYRSNSFSINHLPEPVKLEW